jgi:hypothetical protein
MLVTSCTVRRIELVRRQQDLTMDIVCAADAIAIQERLLEVQVILGWLPGEDHSDHSPSPTRPAR